MSTGDIEDLGPIDIVVIGYPAGAPMTGEAATIMVDLVDRGIIRVLDATIVIAEGDGKFSGISIEDMDDERIGEFAVFQGATSGLVGDDDLGQVASAMEPGETAVVIVYENRWAAPFAAAVRRNGGRLIASERVTVQDLVDALDALEA
jgi:hypothetical protein